METQKQVNEMKTYFDTKKRIEENETARLNRIQSWDSKQLLGIIKH